MLHIKKEFVSRLQSAGTVQDIYPMLEGAITLELATLPTYLTGVFSVKPGTNEQAKALVESVAIEEMLHMSLATNILISIGGTPNIRDIGTTLQFPTYPPVPVEQDLLIQLAPLTKEQIYNVFMAIEHPDTTAILPGETTVHPAAKKNSGDVSIAQFYNMIYAALEALVNKGSLANPFPNPSIDRQLDISGWFPGTVPAPYHNGIAVDLASVRAIIDTIIRQGEGADVGTDPINPCGGSDGARKDNPCGSGGSFAHYFKFAEIYYGFELVKDSSHPSGWSYSGNPVPLDPNGIYNFLSNAALSDYPAGTMANVHGTEFYGAYARLLDALDQTFNGNPDFLSSAIGIMYEMKLLAQKVSGNSLDSGSVAAPPFQLKPGSPKK